MANESESKKLNDLRVVDLRTELEKRSLDKTGVKAVLIERLQEALKEEGHDPETYLFDLSDVKKTPTRGRKSEEEVSEDDKVEEEEDTTAKPKTKLFESKENNENTSDPKPEVKEEITESTQNPEGANKTNEITQNSDHDEKTEELKKEEKGGSKGQIPSSGEPKADVETQNEPSKEKAIENTSEKTEVIDSKPSQTSSGDESLKPQESEESSQNKPQSVTPKEVQEKTATEANGVIDNEDSINLTIGEDEEKLLADEEDSNQEKDHKDENHGCSGHKKSTAGEKAQDKTNQEKMDGKSPSVGDKAPKDDKNKKLASGSSSRNLWVSGLATTTRATDLKQVFSKYGKVIGAKVVTNARTPGARCYGYVTMSNPDDANKAVQFLHHTELHGRLISVEKAKGDSTGPPKRSEPAKVESPTKKVEEKKKEQVVRKVDLKKEETLVPPGTEGDEKQPEAPGTEGSEAGGMKKEEKESGSTHRSRETIRRSSPRAGEKRPRSTTSSHRSGRGTSPVLSFEKIKEERERQRLREKERMLREEERRRETERQRQREIDIAQREEFERLERERKKLKMERERLLREKDELMKLKLERQRLQNERQKLERERLEKEKEELERLKRQNLRLEEEVRRKRSLSSSRDREYESKRHRATDTRYVTSSSSRYPDSPRSNDFKKDPAGHKSSRDLAPPPRRPGFEPDSSRRLVTSVSSSSRDNWPSKDRESRYERTSVNSSSFRDDSISSRTKPSESRLVRERYNENSKSDRFVERSSDSWHGGSSSGGGGSIKPFSSRGETWVSGAGDRKPDHIPEPWSRPTNSSTRWPSNAAPLGMGSRSGPQSGMSNPMFGSSNLSTMPSMGIGMSNLGPFSGGDRFDAYKQPYFKGP